MPIYHLKSLMRAVKFIKYEMLHIMVQSDLEQNSIICCTRLIILIDGLYPIS